MTKIMESSFTLPDDLNYHQNGMIFGARLMESATRMQITDSSFAQSINAYSRQCVFPALFLGHLDMNDLMESTDIWATVTASPSPARMFELRTRDPDSGVVTRQIVTCAAGAPILTGAWNDELDRAASIFGRRLFPTRDENLARAHLLAGLPHSHDYLIGASRGALDIMRQQMTINAIHHSISRWVGETGNAAAMNSYIQARTDVQTRSAYQSIGISAGKLVPTLKSVFEGLFYGFFPIAVLLMITPVGLSVFKSYFFGFVWLQSWGPLYAILNRMMMSDAKSGMEAVADMGDVGQGISMIAQAGIRSVEADIAVSAGYLSASIPFIALLLIKGGVHYAASLATSYLAVGQQAASEAAREGTTGNISLGNTTQDVHSFARSEGFRSHQSPSSDHSRFSSTQEDGSVMTYHADGRTTAVAGTSQGQMTTSVDLAALRSDSLRESASDSRSLGETQSAQATSHYGAAAVSGANMVSQVSKGISSSEGWTQSLTGDEREAFGRVNDYLNKVSETTGLDRTTALKAFVGGNLDSSGTILGKVGEWATGLSGKAGIEGEGRTVSQDQVDELKSYSQNEDLRKDLSTALSAAQRVSAESSDSELQSLGESYSANLSEARGFDETASAHLSQAQSYEKQADQVESNSASINRNMSGAYLNYVAGKLDSWGQPIGHAEANRLDRSNDPADIKQMRIWGKEFADLYHPTTSPPDPDSAVLQGHFNTVRDGLKNQAGINTTHDGNLAQVRAVGSGLTGANVDSVRNDVEGRINDIGDRIAQGEEQVVAGNEQRKAEISQEANKTALAGSGVVGELAQEYVATPVSDFVFGNENQSSGDLTSEIEDRLSEVERDRDILRSDINRSVTPSASENQQQIEKSLGRGGSSRTAQARRQRR